MARRLRFAMVTTFYPPYHRGGDAIQVYRLSEALAARGHQVAVVHSQDAYRLRPGSETPGPAFDRHPNVTIHGLETTWGLASALAAHQLGRPGLYSRRLRRLLGNGDFDVVHFHNVSLLGGPGVFGFGGGVKLYTAHEYWLVCPTHVLFAFDREACTERRCLRCTVVHYHRPPQAWRATGALRRGLAHVDALVMESRFAREAHRAQGIDRPMVVLPPIVPELPDDGREEPDLPGRPFFLYVGRLERLKGVDDLLSAFASYREADLVVVGTGSLEARWRERARGWPHVRFLGRRHPASLGRLYRRAIAVVVPSLCYETFGLTLAESLACGTPVLARRIGALAEVLEETGGGLAFDTVEELRAAMETLRTDAPRRRSLGERGRQAARRLWSGDAHLHAYLDLVDGLQRDPGRAASAAGSQTWT
ncbi:MAG TPA: glycosyltransferase family 4 protein [Vicinamibacteria bacterium]|nr:glycosyltransferase family 4 protein [Vicinamibacteria bacterium]